MKQHSQNLSLLAMAMAAASLLSACGGGGGDSVRADPPPLGPPPVPPPPPPPPPPTEPVVGTPDPAYSRHLLLTGAAAAHEAGLTGAGVRIGIVDSGVNRSHPAMRDRRVIANLTYINPNTNDLSVDDVVEHGTAVAQVAAGMPFGAWPGGIAPGAEIVSARIIGDEPPEDDGSGEGNEVNGALGLAPIHRDLINHGVRVMNNSWGGLYWTNAAATSPIAAEYRPFIVDHGGLVVFSTGNSGFDNPSDTAALPSQPGTNGSMPAADLERGWLAVGALDDDDPTRLAEYSNACGLAMHYCMVAPGTVVVTGTDDPADAPSYWRWRGTSFSAPIVSGAAALVWEAFPYFDNNLVRQTLLGTATDLGAAGVDAVFGYGALDIAAAIRGPARFDWGDVAANVTEAHSVWSNPISGEGGLIKRGAGVLELAGDELSYRGDTRVEAGELRLAGSLLASDVSIASAGSLRLAGGTVGTSVDNRGTLILPDIANAGGLISGDYIHRDDASLHVFLGGGPLTVGGLLDLQGGTLHVAGTTTGYVNSGRETLLASPDSRIQGQFDALSFNRDLLFLEGTLEYSPMFVRLVISRLDVLAAARGLAGMTPGMLSSAQRVENAFVGIDARQAAAGAGPGGEVERVAGAFQQLGEAAAAKAALASLSGESHALSNSLAFDVVDMGRRSLSSRWGQLDASGAQGLGVWKQALGQVGAGGVAGGGFALDGWMVGHDQSLQGGHAAGFAFGESIAENRVGASRDRSRARQTQASAYAGRLFGDGYAIAHASTGRFDRDIERQVFDGAEARAGVFGSYNGRFSSVGVEVGRHHRVGAMAVTSYLGADNTRLDSDGFREWGSAFALQTRESSLQRTQAIAGVRAKYPWRGATLRAYGEWQQVLSTHGFDLAASFTGIDSWAPLPLADAVKSGGLFGFGFDAPLGRRSALQLGLDQRFGPRGDERMASLRYRFAF